MSQLLLPRCGTRPGIVRMATPGAAARSAKARDVALHRNVLGVEASQLSAKTVASVSPPSRAISPARRTTS
ncbi:MAG: hypothetical protein JWL96_843 [Sphingomonas bacterium]|uniref:hypothetical protein n=1 Tax=Sphingomonas bacterium TaxID=1895847 RepID=UPI002621E2CE|nr:hypothetical protein [Sphingomonas bacterium]MDB5708773.1 hypothetical protein [Sphingomonas bacterium]